MPDDSCHPGPAGDRSVLDRLLARAPSPCPRCGVVLDGAPNARCPGCGVRLDVRVDSSGVVPWRAFAIIAGLLMSGGFGALLASLVIFVTVFRGERNARMLGAFIVACILTLICFLPAMRWVARPTRLLRRSDGVQQWLLAAAILSVPVAGVAIGYVLR